eukprot:gene13304-17671_t
MADATTDFFIARLDDLARRPDQNVGIPDRRHAVLGGRLDEDLDFAHAKVDRPGARRFGEAEERPGHQVLRVARGEFAGQRAEQVELTTARRDGEPTHRRTGPGGLIWPVLSLRAGRTTPASGSWVERRAPLSAQACVELACGSDDTRVG